VDAENPTGALGLYERAGFEKVMTNASYAKEL
jgi:ribosomal protein S18 acetylase RimI-like enzyme